MADYDHFHRLMIPFKAIWELFVDSTSIAFLVSTFIAFLGSASINFNGSFSIVSQVPLLIFSLRFLTKYWSCHFLFGSDLNFRLAINEPSHCL